AAGHPPPAARRRPGGVPCLRSPRSAEDSVEPVMSTTTLPEQLSDPARAFAGRRHELLIDGAFVPAADGRTFETIDPSTGRPITTVAQAGASDIERAVAAARRALEEGPWR